MYFINPSRFTVATPPLGAGDILMFTIGQSNDVGRADIDGDAVTVPSGCYEYFNSSNTVATLADPTGEAGSTAVNGSHHPNMVKRLHELTGKNIYVVKRSLGNTAITEWQAGGYIDGALTAFNNFLTYAAAHSITIGYIFVHWLQGENDAGLFDADGYISELDTFKGYVMAQTGANAFLSTRIGYDPNFASSGASEEIMKAQTAFNYLTTTNALTYVLTTNQSATFTTGNAKKKADNVHYTLKGLNDVAEAIAQSMNQWGRYGTKITQPTEPVSALSGISTDSTLLARYAALIDGPWDWEWLFSSSLAETGGKVNSPSKDPDDLYSSPSVSYDSDGLVFDRSFGIFIMKRLSITTATIEWRSKVTRNTGSPIDVLCGSDNAATGGFGHKIVFEHDYTGTPYRAVYFGTSGSTAYWDISSIDINSFHTYKIVLSSGTATLYVDGSSKGGQSVTGPFQLRWLGYGHSNSSYRFTGTLDYFKIKNSL